MTILIVEVAADTRKIYRAALEDQDTRRAGGRGCLARSTTKAGSDPDVACAALPEVRSSYRTHPHRRHLRGELRLPRRERPLRDADLDTQGARQT